MQYRFLVLDLDGTLTNSQKVITPRTKEVLMRAQEKGVCLVLASGRPTHGIVHLAEELELNKYGGYILAFNGAKIIEVHGMKTVFDQHIERKYYREIIDFSKEYGVDILTYQGDEILLTNKENPYAKIEARITGMTLRQEDDLEKAIQEDVPKFILLGNGDDAYLADVEQKMKDKFQENLSISRSEAFFLEVMAKGIDKAKSLERLLEIKNATKEEMIVCGDGYNDLSMISFAGLGVAMGNAVDGVKNVADYVTLSNDEDGVAKVVEEFIF